MIGQVEALKSSQELQTAMASNPWMPDDSTDAGEVGTEASLQSSSDFSSNKHLTAKTDQKPSSSPVVAAVAAASCVERREGLVTFCCEGGVFYNPAQVLNRDLSIVCIAAFGNLIKHQAEARKVLFRGFTVAECLAATGIRGLRYLKELDCVTHVLFNDADSLAVFRIRQNCQRNKAEEAKISVHCSDARDLLYRLKTSLAFKATHNFLPGCAVPTSASSHFDCDYAQLVDVIDIDPYGSVATYIDAAVQAARNGGLLCFTSTDMQVLCGSTPEVAFYKYGCSSIKAKYGHELALRIVMTAVIMSAARYRRLALPLACFSIDFYVRLFVQIKDSPEGCKSIPSNTGIVHQCGSCDSFVTFPLGTDASPPSEDRIPFAARYPGFLAKRAETTADMPTATHPIIPAASPSAQEPSCAKDKGSDITYVPTAQENPREPCRAEERTSTGQGCSHNCRTRNRNDKKQCALKAALVPEYIQAVCQECDGRLRIVGPLYCGPLFSQEFVKECLEVCSCSQPGITMAGHIRGMLTAMKEEIPDVPLYYLLPSLCARVKLPMMKPSLFRTALRNLGYRASHFHREPQAIKTDAPNSVVFDILRTYAKDHPPSVPLDILQRPVSTMDISFSASSPITERPLGKPTPRWLPNPQPHWGPKTRPKRKLVSMSGDGARDNDKAATRSNAADDGPRKTAKPPET